MAEKKGGKDETSSSIEAAVRKYLQGEQDAKAAKRREKVLKAFADEEDRQERITLTGMPLVKRKTPEIPSSSETLTPMPLPAQPKHPATAYSSPQPLSEEEKGVLGERFGRESVQYKGFTDPKHAGSGRMLVERVREEKGFVDKLEKHGFPKGLPDFTPFMAAFGPVSDRPMDFNTRRAYLRQFASMPPEELRQFRNAGLAYILKMRFGEKAARALALLPEKNKAEVLNAVREHEELRHELHGRGFSRELPIPESLSDTLDVAPTALSEHAPEFAEFDRYLQSLRELKMLPEARLKVHARYVAGITGRKLE